MIEYTELLKGFSFALIIGIFMGLEREFSKRKYKISSFGGIRTFILISIFGALSGYFSTYFKNIWLVIIPFIILSLLVLISYYFMVKRSKTIHATTGISAIIVFILSLIVFYGFGKFAVALSILIAVLLSSRIYLHRFIEKITKKELQDILKFAIIVLVVLPFLPNKAYGPFSILNPYLIWLMVIFVSAISFVGYILIKIYGDEKGIGITGFIGGLVSSTAVAMTFSEKSKKASKLLTNAFSLAVVIASTTMFLRILFEVFVINKSLLKTLIIPFGIMIIAGGIFSYYFFRTKKSNKGHRLKLKSPFTLKPSLKFGIFFALVLFVSKAAQVYLGTTGIYITSLLSGLADVDAITLSMARLSAEGAIAEKVASSAITLAALSNTVVKLSIVSLWGSKGLKKRVAIALGVIVIIGVLSVFLL